MTLQKTFFLTSFGKTIHLPADHLTTDTYNIPSSSSRTARDTTWIDLPTGIDPEGIHPLSYVFTWSNLRIVFRVRVWLG